MYHVEEWERRARESQAWADQRRVDVPKDRSDARWFWALFGIVALLVVTASLMLLAPLAQAKQVRWNVATASVYDGVGLGGRVACKGYWPGGYVVAHKYLPCGTRVRFLYRGRKVTARVWDRGPYVAGREFDLDVRVQRALGFPYGIGPVLWRIVR